MRERPLAREPRSSRFGRAVSSRRSFTLTSCVTTEAGTAAHRSARIPAPPAAARMRERRRQTAPHATAFDPRGCPAQQLAADTKRTHFHGKEGSGVRVRQRALKERHTCAPRCRELVYTGPRRSSGSFSEAAVRVRCVELAPEGASRRRDDHADVLGWRSGLVAHHVAAPVVDEPLTLCHDMWRAGGIVI